MKQFGFRVDDEIAEAFYRFCDRSGVTPYDLLGSIVGFYGRAEVLSRKIEKKEITQPDAMIELGRILADMKKFAKANGEFQKATSEILKPYGVTMSQLGMT